MKNTGFVNAGVSVDTAEFAVESIKQWWCEISSEGAIRESHPRQTGGKNVESAILYMSVVAKKPHCHPSNHFMPGV